MSAWLQEPDSNGYWWISFPDGDMIIGNVFTTSAQSRDDFDAARAEISFGYGMTEVSFPVRSQEFTGCEFQKVKLPDQ